MNNLKLEILGFNYWETFKFAKELSLVLSIDHPKRKVLEIKMNEMLVEINKIRNEKDIKETN